MSSIWTSFTRTIFDLVRTFIIDLWIILKLQVLPSPYHNIDLLKVNWICEILYHMKIKHLSENGLPCRVTTSFVLVVNLHFSGLFNFFENLHRISNDEKFRFQFFFQFFSKVSDKIDEIKQITEFIVRSVQPVYYKHFQLVVYGKCQIWYAVLTPDTKQCLTWFSGTISYAQAIGGTIGPMTFPIDFNFGHLIQSISLLSLTFCVSFQQVKSMNI